MREWRVRDAAEAGSIRAENRGTTDLFWAIGDDVA
jgi:hypothetical protein